LVGTARRCPVPRDSRDEDEAALVENGHLFKEELSERVTVVDIPNAGDLQPLGAPRPVADAVIAFAR
jgi:hypothetical protein